MKKDFKIILLELLRVIVSKKKVIKNQKKSAKSQSTPKINANISRTLDIHAAQGAKQAGKGSPATVNPQIQKTMGGNVWVDRGGKGSSVPPQAVATSPQIGGNQGVIGAGAPSLPDATISDKITGVKKIGRKKRRGGRREKGIAP